MIISHSQNRWVPYFHTHSIKKKYIYRSKWGKNYLPQKRPKVSKNKSSKWDKKRQKYDEIGTKTRPKMRQKWVKNETKNKTENETKIREK